MQVYVENNVTGKGLWIALPQPKHDLINCLDTNHLTADGEYQMTALSFDNFPIQECTGNLFQLNQKMQRYLNLPDWQKELLLHLAFEKGISIETALIQYL